MSFTLELLFLIILNLCIHNVISEDEKRLLLNDPSSVQSLLHQYETQLNKYGIALQQVESKMAALEGENAKLRVENGNTSAYLKQIEKTIAVLSSENSDLKSENKDMNASLMMLQAEKIKLQTRISVLETNNQSGLVTYVRWGRTSCPSDPKTELLYKGLTGGSSYYYTGSGVNALCLPHNPDNGVKINGLTLYGGDHASIYGAEYQYNHKNIKVDDDVPCAVCVVKQATSVLMMPAKTTCPAGWKRQYYGILTATHDGQHASSEYTCMDDDPEYVEGSRSHNDDGKLFYPVKFVCGSLPCPPYTNGEFVECAICTR